MIKTVSLEIAKKLKEAGYPQRDCEFYWIQFIKNGEWKLFHKFHEVIEFHYPDFAIASPTSDELGEALYSDGNKRAYLDFPKPTRVNIVGKLIVKWKIPNDEEYMNFGGLTPTFSHFIFSETEADARAKMWLYLKKNNLL